MNNVVNQNVNTNMKDIKFEELLKPRIPPNIWDVIGYGGGLTTIFYYNKLGIIFYSCFFVVYGLLNIMFDYFTVAFEFTNSSFPTYQNIGNYNWFIPSKKYKLDNGVMNVDESRLMIEISLYLGENHTINNTLNIIYLLGITKKNYTNVDIRNFKSNILFVNQFINQW
jgi:hypothetical protein